MRKLRLAELIGLLNTHSGAVIVSMTARTEPTLLRKSRGTGQPVEERYPEGIEKIVRGRFMLASAYGANVRAQRKREGHPHPERFRAGKLWAGKGVRLCRFLAQHVETKHLYVVARPASDEHGYPVRLHERWIDLHQVRDVEGEELAELQTDWLKDPPRKPAKKQQLARQIPYRTYRVGSIHSITFGGETYGVEEDRPAYVLNDES